MTDIDMVYKKGLSAGVEAIILSRGFGHSIKSLALSSNLFLLVGLLKGQMSFFLFFL